MSGSSVVLQLYNHQTKRWGDQRMKHLMMMMRRPIKCYTLWSERSHLLLGENKNHKSHFLG